MCEELEGILADDLNDARVLAQPFIGPLTGSSAVLAVDIQQGFACLSQEQCSLQSLGPSSIM